MLAFIIAVLFNSTIGVIFKFLASRKIRIYPAIIINYIVCALIGWGVYYEDMLNPSFWQAAWLSYGIILGIIFIIGFYLASLCVIYHGIGLTAMMQKVSMIITVLFAILYYNESAGWAKWIGIGIAICAIIMLNWRKKEAKARDSSWFILALPVFVFLVNGLIDTIIFQIKNTGEMHVEEGHFTSAIFSIAAVLGIVIGISLSWTRKLQFGRKEVWGGILLGVPNFISIYAIFWALDSGWGGSVLFPLLNISIILCSLAAGYFVFSEKSNRIQVIGLILAILAIVLIASEI